MLNGHSRQSNLLIQYPTIFRLYQKLKKQKMILPLKKNPCKGREGQIGRAGLRYIHYHVLDN